MSRAAIACALAALLSVAGCGGSSRHASGGLTWSRTPLLYAPARLQSDRVVMGRVRNESPRMLALDARRLVVRDAAGRKLVSSARFTNSYAHPLYGAFQQPRFNEPSELARLGMIIDLQPGVTAPLYVAYRLRPESTPPITVDYGAGALRLPR